jgi:hypothetical protein
MSGSRSHKSKLDECIKATAVQSFQQQPRNFLANEICWQASIPTETVFDGHCCLAWNIPEDSFEQPPYLLDFKAV